MCVTESGTVYVSLFLSVWFVAVCDCLCGHLCVCGYLCGVCVSV